MSKLHSIEQFSSIIRDSICALKQSEDLPLEQCFNRISAEDLLAPFDLPESPISAMDGYALLASDWQPDKLFEVSQKIMADTIPKPHTPGSLARIFTGGRLPEGTDCVVIQENSRLDKGLVCLDKSAVAGQNVRTVASNFARGQKLFSSGSPINTPKLALAAMAGRSHIRVSRKLRVCVLTLGDELIAPGQSPVPGKLYDSNGIMIASLLRGYGCIVEHRTLGDDRDLIRKAMIDAADDSDLVISTGGASVGERDYVCSVIADAGELHAWKVAIKPGKPTVFGCIHAADRKVPFFGLPGNPSSSMITFAIFVRLAIYKLLSVSDSDISAYSLPLINSYSNKGDRHEFLYCRRGINGLKTCDRQDSASLISAAMATGICHITPHLDVLEGDMVDYYPLGELFSL